MYESLVEGLSFEFFLGGKVYDASRILADLEARNATVVVLSTKSRTQQREISKELYAFRYLIECMFHGLKRFRCIATRYEKRAHTYEGMLPLACAMLCLA